MKFASRTVVPIPETIGLSGPLPRLYLAVMYPSLGPMS